MLLLICVCLVLRVNHVCWVKSADPTNDGTAIFGMCNFGYFGLQSMVQHSIIYVKVRLVEFTRDLQLRRVHMFDQY